MPRLRDIGSVPLAEDDWDEDSELAGAYRDALAILNWEEGEEE